MKPNRLWLIADQQIPVLAAKRPLLVCILWALSAVATFFALGFLNLLLLLVPGAPPQRGLSLSIAAMMLVIPSVSLGLYLKEWKRTSVSVVIAAAAWLVSSWEVMAAIPAVSASLLIADCRRNVPRYTNRTSSQATPS